MSFIKNFMFRMPPQSRLNRSIQCGSFFYSFTWLVKTYESHMKTVIRLQAICVLIFNSQLTLAGPVKDETIEGIWMTASQEGLIKIYKNAKTIEGRVFRVFDPEDTNRVDNNNPDPEQRNRPLLGLVILRGFNFDGVKRWTGGHIYDPNTGMTYRASLELINENKLALRGYVGIPLFGRREIWTRKN